jgi:uncharacterized membrane protein
MPHVFSGLVAVGLMLSAMLGQAKADYTFTTLDPPGSTDSTAYGINGSGQIVGTYGGAGVGGIFLRDVDGSYSTLDDVPDSIGFGTQPDKINASGHIVGAYLGLDMYYGPRFYGFLRDVDGSYTTLDVPGSHDTFALGINGSGQIVGGYNGHGFLRDVDGSYTTLDLPGSRFTAPSGISGSGQIAGT